MDSRDELLEKLEIQLDIEKNSFSSYSKYVSKLSDPKIVSTLKEIIEDESEHMGLVKEMISLVKGYTKKVSVVRPKEAPTPFGEMFETASTILLTSSVEKYMESLVSLVKTISTSRNILYVSYNKLPNFTKKVLEGHDVDLSKIRFVNCTENPSKEDISVRPDDLTKLSIILTKETRGNRNQVLVFDNLFSALIFNQLDTVSRFVSVINDYARTNGFKVIWVVTDNPESQALIARVRPLCDIKV